MEALEARDPELSKQLADLQRRQDELRIARALRMLPDDQPQVLRQGAYGQYIKQVQLALFYQDADATTVVHELFHHFIENNLLPNSLLTALHDSFAVKNGDTGERVMTTAAKENAANAFIAFVRGNNPPKGSTLARAFLEIKKAVAVHLEDMNELVQVGSTVATTGKPLKISNELARWFKTGIQNRADDELSVIYGRALTSSMLAGELPVERDPDTAIRTSAEAIDKDHADWVAKTVLMMNRDLFMGKEDVGQLTQDEKYTLATLLRNEAPGIDDPSPRAGIWSPTFKSRAEMILDAVLTQPYRPGPAEAALNALEATVKQQVYSSLNTSNTGDADKIASDTMASLYQPDGTAARREAEAKVGRTPEGRRLIQEIARSRQPEQGVLLQRRRPTVAEAQRTTKEYLTGDPETRKAAKQKLRDMGASDEVLEPKVSDSDVGKMRTSVVKQYMSAYGMSFAEALEYARNEALQMFGDAAAKTEGDQVRGSLTMLNAQQLKQLMLDDRELEQDSEELRKAQEMVASNARAKIVDGYMGPAMSADTVMRKVARGGLSVWRWMARRQNLYTLVNRFTGENPNDPLYRAVIYNGQQGGVARGIRMRSRYASRFWEKLKETTGYVSTLELSRDLDIGGYTLNRGEALGLYFASNFGESYDTAHMRKLEASRRFIKPGEAEKAARAAVKYITEKEPGLAKLAEWMDAEARMEYEKAREVARTTGVDLPEPTKDRYLPIAYKDGAVDPSGVTGMVDRGFDNARWAPSTPEGAEQSLAAMREFNARTEGAGIGMNLDAVSLHLRHMDTVLHFSSNAQWISDALRLLQDQHTEGGKEINPVRQAFLEKFGDDEHFKALVDHLKRAGKVANTLRVERDIEAERLMRYVRGNAPSAFLSWNPWVVTMQLVSAFHVIGNMGIKHVGAYVRSIGQIMGQWRLGETLGGTAIQNTEMYKFVERHAPAQADMIRSIAEREVRIGLEAMKKNPFNAKGMTILGFRVGEAIEKGYVPMQTTDAIFRLAAWKTAFDAKTEELGHGTDSDSEIRLKAVAYANKIVGESMNPADPNEIPLAYTEAGEFGKSLQLFSGQPQAEMRAFMNNVLMPMVSSYAIARKAGANRGIATAKALRSLATGSMVNRLLFTMVIPSIALGAIQRRRLPTFEEMLKDMMVYGLAMKIPYAGPALVGSVIFGFDPWEELTSASLLKRAGSAFSPENWKTPASAANAVRQFTSIASGFPDWPSRVMTVTAKEMLDNGEDFSTAIQYGLGSLRKE